MTLTVRYQTQQKKKRQGWRDLCRIFLLVLHSHETVSQKKTVYNHLISTFLNIDDQMLV